MALEKATKVENTKLDAVEAFKKNDTFKHAVAVRSEKALKSALGSVQMT